MFDDLPVQVWLLLFIAAVGYGPALHVYRGVARSPQPAPVAETSPALASNVAILVALAALAVFIFTPAAAQFARSPEFWPILMAACGVWALTTVPRALASGQIQPFVRGIRNTCDRDLQPKRFWASVGWNALISCLWLGFAFDLYADAPARALRDRCFDWKTAYSPWEELSACDRLISERDQTDGLGDLIAARGSAYYRLADYRHAMADYSQAIAIDPRDHTSFYNRGLTHERLDDGQRAVADYTAAIRLKPSMADAYLMRGLIYLDTGSFDEAVADFTRLHELRPNDPWALANRGIAYAWKRDRAKAEKDIAAVEAIDPSNPVLLRGRALLSLNAGDPEAAIGHLTAALKQDPNDMWSLKMRSKAYRWLGDDEKSRADAAKLQRLRMSIRDHRLTAGLVP